MKESTQVGIVILNWNSYEVTYRCLKAFYDQHIDAKLILVDNASKDGSGDRLSKAFKDIKLIQTDKNLGFTGGCNLGIEYCLEQNMKYVMLLNNDTYFENDFVKPMMEYLEVRPEVGVIQPKIFFYHNREIIWNAGAKFFPFIAQTKTKAEGHEDDLELNKQKEVDWVTGCCFFTRSDILRQVGKLDDAFFAYYEDVDLSFRIRKQGYRLIYFPKSTIYHIAGVSLTAPEKGREGYLLPSFHYYNIRNQLFIIRKHSRWYHLPSVTLYFSGKVFLFLMYFIIRLRFQKARMLILGVVDGLTRPFGIKGTI